MSTQTYFGTLSVEICCTCGMAFGLPSDYQQHRRDDHKGFYCPSGHEQSYYAKSELEKARDALALERHRAEQAQARADTNKRWAEAAERKASAQSGVTTRIKNRIKHGVCPCCKRTFQDLARHMSGKHPAYANEVAT